MARLAVSKDYFGAYARLPRKAQPKADEFLAKFQRDSTTLSIHLEPIHGVLDSQLRSARIGDDYRVILRAPPTGDVFLVLWADHHDEAYRWAATKQRAVHPATGSLQIFDATPTTAAVAASADVGSWSQSAGATEAAPTTSSSVATPAGLFSTFDDSSLFLAGVPSVLLPSVRAIASDSDLDAMLPHLPPESGEVLTGLAAGLSLDDALEEVLGRLAPPAGAPLPPPIDVTDVAGGGLELALSGDIIMASSNATFALPEIRSGTVADAASIKLPKRIPYHVAMDLLLTGRWFDAEEALRWGLIKEICAPEELMQKTWALARLLESGPPLVYAAIKEVVREAENMRFQDALNRITKRQMRTVERLYSSEDQLEGARAVAEKRDPVWKGR